MPTTELSAPDVDDLPIDLRERPTIRESVQQTRQMTWRALVIMRRNPEQLIDVVFSPIVFTVMFAYVFGGAISGDVESYLPLLVPGLLAQTVIFASMTTGVQLRNDLNKGVTDRFRSLPISRIAPLAGPMVADIVRYLIAIVLTVAMGMLLGYRPGGGLLGVLGASALLVLAGWSLAWVFCWVGSIVRSTQSVQGISLLIMFPLVFLSNAYVPSETMPGWLQAFVHVNPVTYIVTAVRDLTNAGAVTGSVAGSLVACIALVAIFAPLSLIGYNRAR